MSKIRGLIVGLMGLGLLMWVGPASAQGTEPPKLPSYDTMMAIFMVVGVVLLLVVGFLFGKQQGLNETLKAVQADTITQTKVEGALFDRFGKEGMALIRTGGMGLFALGLAISPDDWDATLELAKDIHDRLTDGLENLPPG